MPQRSSSSGTWLLKRGGISVLGNDSFDAVASLWDDLSVTWDDVGF